MDDPIATGEATEESIAASKTMISKVLQGRELGAHIGEPPIAEEIPNATEVAKSVACVNDGVTYTELDEHGHLIRPEKAPEYF